jgi:uncharacterized protein
MSERGEGFLPGAHQIEAYGAGGFRFGGMSHRGSIIAAPSGVTAIAALRLEELDAATLAPLFSEPVGAVQLVVLGTGASLVVPPRALRETLRAAGMGVDPMATGHAVATYNILLGEGRRVAAVLLASA